MVEIAKVTKEIYSLLSDFQKNVFPIVATEGTSLPFIVFERSNAYDVGTKDGNQVELSYIIRIVTATYFDGLRMLDDIRSALRHSALQPTLTSATEEYTNDGFVQTISISI